MHGSGTRGGLQGGFPEWRSGTALSGCQLLCVCVCVPILGSESRLAGSRSSHHAGVSRHWFGGARDRMMSQCQFSGGMRGRVPSAMPFSGSMIECDTEYGRMTFGLDSNYLGYHGT